MRGPRWGCGLALGAALILSSACTEDESDDTDEDGYADDIDCAPGDPAIHPGTVEACDGLDSDCDGILPPAELDGEGDGVSDCGGDCDDEDPERRPGAPERCNGLDDDCNGVSPPDEADEDTDGTRPCGGDCDDEDDRLHPGAEDGCDGLDNDCDGTTALGDTDADADGWLACGSDCDDSDPDLSPVADELAGNPIDEDCDGLAPLTCDGAAHCIDLGGTADWPAPACADPALIAAGAAAAWIDADGAGPMQPVQLVCDSVSDGGGWTLVLETDASGPGHAVDQDLATALLATLPIDGVARLDDASIDTILTLGAGEMRVEAGDGTRSMDVRGFGFATFPTEGTATVGEARLSAADPWIAGFQCWGGGPVTDPSCSADRWCFGKTGAERFCLRDGESGGIWFDGGTWSAAFLGARLWVR